MMCAPLIQSFGISFLEITLFFITKKNDSNENIFTGMCALQYNIQRDYLRPFILPKKL